MSNLSSNIPIVILAAGASKRMQSPKQLLNWGESTLLNHAIDEALKSIGSEVFVVLGANYSLIKESVSQTNITILNNKNWKNGLGSSIAFASKQILELDKNNKGVLFMLADQPFIDEHFLNDLISEFAIENKSIVATSYEEAKYGVPVIFSNKYFKELSILSNDKGAKHLLKKYKSNIKTLVPPVKNVDLDSQEDYKKYHNSKFKSN